MSKRYLLVIFSLLFVLINVNSQSIKELEAQKSRAMQKLKETQTQLQKTKRSKKGTQQEIELLNRYIKDANKLIFAINSELDGLNRDISNIQTEKTQLTAQLEKSKKNYAKMVAKNNIFRKQFSAIHYIFSSKNFSQGYRRIQYLNKMSRYRKEQGEKIEALTKNLSDKESQLHVYVQQKSTSLHQKEKENKNLSKQKRQQDNLLKKYSLKEKELNKTIRQEEQRTKKLTDLIRKKVAEENRKKEEMARKAKEERKRLANKKSKGDKSTAGSKSKKETPLVTAKEYKQYTEDVALSGMFEQNKGRLPMPVANGRIYRHFGRQTNPNTQAVENNSGIYVLAPEGTNARAVFDGTVFEVMHEPGAGYLVWVTHGSYSTVYAQLSLVFVKKGEKIKARQSVGKIALKNNQTELNFYLLNKNANYENPVLWLSH